MTSTLAGIRVISTALNIPGPVAAAMLRDMGAAVVKIELPSGDPLALAAPQWYSELCDGIDVRRIDLKSLEGRHALDTLLQDADLLITASRPASLERLGLAWPEVHSKHPRLCQVAIVGHPPPREEVAGHDVTYQAAAGLLTSDRRLPATLIADLAGAEQVVIAALALLLARERGGDAALTSVSLVAAATLFAEPLRHRLTSPGGALGGALAVYGVYQALDGCIAVAALEPQFRAALARELNVNVEDPVALTRVFVTRTAAEWERWAEARGLPIAKVR